MLVTAKLLAGLVLASTLLPAQGVIEGRIINSATKLGIEGVKAVFFTGRGARYEAVSSPQGAFRLTDVAEGNYATTLQRTGYDTKVIGLDLQRGKDTPMHVSANQTI